MIGFTDGEEDGLIDNIILQQTVQALPDKQKIVVAMVSAAYTQKEIAAVIGLTKAAVGSIYHKALEVIRRELRS